MAIIGTVALAASLPARSDTASALQRRNPNGQGALVVVGDSLTVGAAAFGSLKSRLADLNVWTRVIVDARTGRKASTGAKVIASRLATSADATAIVIAMGTNDMISNANPGYPRTLIDTVMARTRGLPVLWVNIEFSSVVHPDWVARATRFNRELRRATARWPRLRVADWNSTFTSGTVIRFVGDGVHLTTTAYRMRARWLTQQARAFGNAIVNETTTTTTVPETSTTITSTTTATTVPATTTTTNPPPPPG